MPRLATIGNVDVRIYFDDAKKHRRAHFHAVSPDRSAVVGIPALDVIEGDLDGRDLAKVLEWARVNRTDLILTWNRCNPGHEAGEAEV